MKVLALNPEQETENAKMLGGVEVPDVNENFNPPTEIEEDPNAENTPGSNFDPDETE